MVSRYTVPEISSGAPTHKHTHAHTNTHAVCERQRHYTHALRPSHNERRHEGVIRMRRDGVGECSRAFCSCAKVQVGRKRTRTGCSRGEEEDIIRVVWWKVSFIRQVYTTIHIW